MKAFILRPRYRLEKEVSRWDRSEKRWKTHALENPRLVENPPQILTKEQDAFLKDYAAKLIAAIKLKKQLRDAELACSELREKFEEAETEWRFIGGERVRY